MAAGDGRALPDPRELVLALGHEIGNLLAATRLHAHLIESDASPGELTEVAETIGELASRMGSLLAQVRPLLTPVPADAPIVDPLEVLDGVRRGIEESCDARVEIDLESAAGLPLALIDPEPLHHILLTSIYQALEESEPDGKVVVSACGQARSIAFYVDAECKLDEAEAGVLRGRALLCAAADAILRPRGGRIDARAHAAGSRIELTVPVDHA